MPQIPSVVVLELPADGGEPRVLSRDGRLDIERHLMGVAPDGDAGGEWVKRVVAEAR
mgnify:CR=1 FL=1